MSIYEEDYEYASEKLPQTVVRLEDGSPVYVDFVDVRNRLCTVRRLDNKNELRVKLKNLDLRSPPLGFANLKECAVYVMRIPKRRDWRQGLRGANCIINGGLERFDNLLNMDIALHNCIIGKYPTIKSILNKMKRVRNVHGLLTVAWDRHWALDNENNVIYKCWGTVGKMNQVGTDITLNPQYTFLRESFEESVG